MSNTIAVRLLTNAGRDLAALFDLFRATDATRTASTAESLTYAIPESFLDVELAVSTTAEGLRQAEGFTLLSLGTPAVEAVYAEPILPPLIETLPLRFLIDPAELSFDIRGTSGGNVVSGGDLADILRLAGGADTGRGGAGDDEIDGGGGRDLLAGEDGADLLLGGGGRDRLFGGRGNDTVEGGAGSDVLRGDAGSDVLFGAGGDDALFGGGGGDLLRAGAGADTAQGGGGRDTLLGGDGADLLVGGGASDILAGEAGNNRLRGGAGDDLLIGGLETDRMEGGNRDDVFFAGSGSDTALGGAGADIFVFVDPAISGAGALGTATVFDGGSGDDRVLVFTDSAGGSAIVRAMSLRSPDDVLNGRVTIPELGLTLDDVERVTFQTPSGPPSLSQLQSALMAPNPDLVETAWTEGLLPF